MEFPIVLNPKHFFFLTKKCRHQIIFQHSHFDPEAEIHGVQA